MRIIAIIPARYQSSRFPGKPLADLCGRPMIWWVYNQVKKVVEIEEVYVATDDSRIAETCDSFDIKNIMTSKLHGTSTERAYEVAQKVPSDLYVVINGDEPLIDPDVIRAIIPDKRPDTDFYVGNLMTEIKSPVEAVDFTNIKVVTDSESNALFMSRSPIPYPKSSIDYKYYKHVGVLIYDINALAFFASTPKGYNEKIEDINELRFIEHGKKLKMTEVNANSLSVDTPKDLEFVRCVVKKKLQDGVNI
ncbi:MAG: 3-deoxy-manno-octulosonate cytidylyltransferase [Lachnospiraceae bacterium]|nr:3-deoxy-manno-octulosonate cytidylyltransferase [Lachnospiraceae bacterium]